MEHNIHTCRTLYIVTASQEMKQAARVMVRIKGPCTNIRANACLLRLCCRKALEMGISVQRGPAGEPGRGARAMGTLEDE